MTAGTETTATAPSRAAEALARDVRAAFLRPPAGLQARCAVPPTGDAALDRPVLVEAADGSEHYEGVVVAGDRDEDGRWCVDDAFTLLTLDTDGPGAVLVTCRGWIVDVESL